MKATKKSYSDLDISSSQETNSNSSNHYEINKIIKDARQTNKINKKYTPSDENNFFLKNLEDFKIEKAEELDEHTINVKKKERDMNINYFVIILVALSQGIQAISDLAIIYLYKDDFKLQPAEVSRISSIMVIPWIIKPLYGFISDSLPILNYRRKPYLFIAGCCVSICWLLMSFWVDSKNKAILVLFISSVCTAFYNVIGEALVIELSQSQKELDPEAGAKNVSLYFMVRSCGSLFGAFFSGYLIQSLSKKSSKFFIKYF